MLFDEDRYWLAKEKKRRKNQQRLMFSFVNSEAQSFDDSEMCMSGVQSYTHIYLWACAHTHKAK